MSVLQLVVFAEERRTFLSALMDAYDSLKTDTLFLPVFLDRYISASAIAMRRSRLFASSERGPPPMTPWSGAPASSRLAARTPSARLPGCARRPRVHPPPRRSPTRRNPRPRGAPQGRRPWPTHAGSL